MMQVHTPPGSPQPSPLRDGDEMFRLMFEHAAVGVAMLDSHTGRFVRVNARYAEIVGRSAAEMLGLTWRDITVPDDVASDVASMNQLVLGEVPRYAKEKRYRHKNGSTVWVNLSVSRTWARGERPSFHVAVVEDITARKAAELALRDSEDRYRTLVENIDGAVFSTDVQGTITFASSGVARFGLTPDNVLGRTLDAVIHPEDLPRLMESRARRLAGAPPTPVDFRIINPSGGIHHARSIARPHLVRGKVVGLTGVIVDVTAQHDTEEQLRVAQKMEAVGRLAGGVAHDFNNLLCVIGMYADLAIEQVANTPVASDIDEIRKAGVSAQALTQQLLAFSRKQVLKPEPLDLNVLIPGVQKMLGRLIGEDIKLSFAPSAGAQRTFADPGQVQQVLLNLAVNSRDAMPRGGNLWMETGSVTVPEPRQTGAGPLPAGDYVMFSVRDNGTGMDAATRARIFEPFFTTKPAGKGTGLGLSTVYGIVKQSGGGIDVESQPGMGTMFRVYLPAHAAPPVQDVAPQATGTSGGNESLLVVEDDDSLREIARRVLTDAGYQVKVARGAQEALEAFAQARGVHLLVTDVVMPGMDGPDLAQRLHAHAPNLKVLYISGHSDEVMAQRGMLDSGRALLPKPFTAGVLLAQVRRVLDASP